MKYLNDLKHLLLKYKHGIVLSYFFIYLWWFAALERIFTTDRLLTTDDIILVYMKLDDFIPFNELFVIPYFLWFFYIFITVTYFFFTSKQEFFKCCAYLFIGMTICLIIYTIWPNGHILRADIDALGRDNVLTRIVARLYKVDTPTNVFPSIHVFNSIGALIAIYKNERLYNIVWLKWSSLILTILICLSTVFLKQHSVADIFGALVLNTFMYFIIYVPAWGKEEKAAKQAALAKASQTSY